MSCLVIRNGIRMWPADRIGPSADHVVPLAAEELPTGSALLFAPRMSPAMPSSRSRCRRPRAALPGSARPPCRARPGPARCRSPASRMPVTDHIQVQLAAVPERMLRLRPPDTTAEQAAPHLLRGQHLMRAVAAAGGQDDAVLVPEPEDALVHRPRLAVLDHLAPPAWPPIMRQVWWRSSNPLRAGPLPGHRQVSQVECC